MMKDLRGRPLIIWGGVVRIEKKNCSEGRQKRKFPPRGLRKKKELLKKKFLRSILPKKNSFRRVAGKNKFRSQKPGPRPPQMINGGPLRNASYLHHNLVKMLPTHYFASVTTGGQQHIPRLPIIARRGHYHSAHTTLTLLFVCTRFHTNLDKLVTPLFPFFLPPPPRVFITMEH